LTIIEECRKHQIGWLPWSWGPGNRPQTRLDMTEDGWADTLFGWGRKVALTSPFSIKNTSRKPPSLLTITESGHVPPPLEEL
jgi:mannan endo-1,4-beta-mannosidase